MEIFQLRTTSILTPPHFLLLLASLLWWWGNQASPHYTTRHLTTPHHISRKGVADIFTDSSDSLSDSTPLALSHEVTNKRLLLNRVSRTLELCEGLEGRHGLLLAAFPHLGAHLLRLLAPHQWLLLRRLHLPDHNRRLKKQHGKRLVLVHRR